MFIDIIMPKGSLKCEIMPLRSEKQPTCRGCGKEIRFAKTPRGKHMPVSLTEDNKYQAHFADCPKADEFRKPKTNEKD